MEPGHRKLATHPTRRGSTAMLPQAPTLPSLFPPRRLPWETVRHARRRCAWTFGALAKKRSRARFGYRRLVATSLARNHPPKGASWLCQPQAGPATPAPRACNPGWTGLLMRDMARARRRGPRQAALSSFAVRLASSPHSKGWTRGIETGAYGRLGRNNLARRRTLGRPRSPLNGRGTSDNRVHLGRAAPSALGVGSMPSARPNCP